MTDEDTELIYSPLTQTHSADGHTLHIHIYRGTDSPWILEIEDELGTSSVWDELFETDTAALAAAFEAIEAEGIHAFVIQARQAAQDAEPELLRRLAPQDPLPLDSPEDMMAPLSDEELDELEAFLLNQQEGRGMTLDMLDGYLHALAIGPETVMPSLWLPRVWGREDGAMVPPVAEPRQLDHLLALVMRHFNSIVCGMEHQPPLVVPFWPTAYDEATGEFEDAEAWAYGFTEGVKLSQAAWQWLLDHPDGQRWYRPIGLLGQHGFSTDQEELTRTAAQRAALAAQIEDNLAHIHAFWLPLRHAMAERQVAQRVSTKVGRNDPCPCGSGKKFKKCCGGGAASTLH